MMGDTINQPINTLVSGAVEAFDDAYLRFEAELILRFTAALLAKRFVILTGLSGSGKTKLAQGFARWICPHQAMKNDVFKPGADIDATKTHYHVMDSDRVAIQFKSPEGVLAVIPRELIREWADCIKRAGFDPSTTARTIREEVAKTTRYSGQLNSFETHLKAAAFALMANEQESVPTTCYELVPVGADWTSKESCLGYPDGLDSSRYVNQPALDLILSASDHPDIPHFLILDEMNLSHVERYFADFLSAIESDEEIPLYEGEERTAGTRVIPKRLRLPANLFVIGTVNVDETTYMFSPKVLDRANVIEFRMAADELNTFLRAPSKPDLDSLAGKGIAYSQAFVTASRRSAAVPASVKSMFEAEMSGLFALLQRHHAEFGYRTVYEASRFVAFYSETAGYDEEDHAWFRTAMDCVIVQKLMPKLHGSRARLAPLLRDLWDTALNPPELRGGERADPKEDQVSTAHYPLSADKIARMWRLLAENGFASFAEA